MEDPTSYPHVCKRAARDMRFGSKPKDLYQDLCHPCDEIRLCKILFEDWNSPINLELQIVSLQYHVDYVALSYESETSAVKQVLVNGYEHLVDAKLFDALRRLREQGHDKNIWIQDLCVNQEHEIEKSQQMNIMGRIFQGAEQVLIWLGDVGHLRSGHENSPQLTTTEEALFYKCIGVVFHHLEEAHLWKLPYSHAGCQNSCPGKKNGSRISPLLAIDSIKILDDPWWKRFWRGSTKRMSSTDMITAEEEVIKIKEATVMRGKLSIPWLILARAAVNWRSHVYADCCRGCTVLRERNRPNSMDSIFDHVDVLSWSVRQSPEKRDTYELVMRFRKEEITGGEGNAMQP